MIYEILHACSMQADRALAARGGTGAGAGTDAWPGGGGAKSKIACFASPLH